jgi:peptidoglycan hydrolase-like protein with peptidoglycan-binding domain
MVDFASLWQYSQSNGSQTCSITINGEVVQSWDFDTAVTSDPSDPTTYPDLDSVDPCAEIPAQPATSGGWPLVKAGDSGALVQAVQDLLNEAGSSLDVNGTFGEETEDAVRSFQVSNSLSADGKVGPNTWKILVVTRRLNNSGSAVSAIQTLLVNYDATFEGYEDGTFDDITDSKVREFQRANAMSADGIVGPNTWRALVNCIQ